MRSYDRPREVIRTPTRAPTLILFILVYFLEGNLSPRSLSASSIVLALWSFVTKCLRDFSRFILYSWSNNEALPCVAKARQLNVVLAYLKSGIQNVRQNVRHFIYRSYFLRLFFASWNDTIFILFTLGSVYLHLRIFIIIIIHYMKILHEVVTFFPILWYDIGSVYYYDFNEVRSTKGRMPYSLVNKFCLSWCHEGFPRKLLVMSLQTLNQRLIQNTVSGPNIWTRK